MTQNIFSSLFHILTLNKSHIFLPHWVSFQICYDIDMYNVFDFQTSSYSKVHLSPQPGVLTCSVLFSYNAGRSCMILKNDQKLTQNKGVLTFASSA